MADTTQSRGFVRYHLTDDQPILVETVDGPLDLGSGWLVVSEVEHRAFVELLATLKNCLSWHDFADDLHQPIEVRAAYMRACATLAKAEGR